MSRNYLDETYEELSETGKIITKTGFQKNYLSVGKLSRPGKKIKDLRAIVLHSVNEITSPITIKNELEQEKYNNSSHYIIGQLGDIVQIIPETEIAVHCKTSLTKKAKDLFGRTEEGFEIVPHNMNNHSIGITLCPIDKSGKFSKETIDATWQLIVSLLEKNETEIKETYEKRIKGYVLKELELELLKKYDFEINLLAETKFLIFVGKKIEKFTVEELMIKFRHEYNDIKEIAKKETLLTHNDELELEYTKVIKEKMISLEDIVVTQYDLNNSLFDPKRFVDYPEDLKDLIDKIKIAL
jgi:N-acetylmuramoyl-L-alanine amidase